MHCTWLASSSLGSDGSRETVRTQRPQWCLARPCLSSRPGIAGASAMSGAPRIAAVPFEAAIAQISELLRGRFPRIRTCGGPAHPPLMLPRARSPPPQPGGRK
ncbi:hypothetical protein Zmor_009832 [Zophobas morio]|uniref:Uncharacterized protein n=1 Tax=Zophobas morio TaxID=2755281 RepID=A0AA38MIW8_9CUCU|nr:hypothetical protein Zmor_009808 [Zophobas morio]KAJ3658066.1 hypothetical protein Zmor_009832 [Zophobas morio]